MSRLEDPDARFAVPREVLDVSPPGGRTPAEPDTGVKDSHLAIERPGSIADDLLAQLLSRPTPIRKSSTFLPGGLARTVRRGGLSRRKFLDDRILSPATQGAWVPIGAVDAARRVTSGHAVHFIFHTGHVGSTLSADCSTRRDGAVVARTVAAQDAGRRP